MGEIAMRRLLLLSSVALAGTATAQPLPVDPVPKISASIRGIDVAARRGNTGLEVRDADPLQIDAAASLLSGWGCYATDDLAHTAPHDPVFRGGALVCEDRRTVVPR